MKTLELKDICGYLPYGLVFQDKGRGVYLQLVNLLSAQKLIDKSHDYTEVGPILRPMSDLTEEITHRGEKFVPLDVFNDRGHFIEFDAAGLLYTVGGCMDSDWLMVFDKFHEWMFDYRGLISAGLAIDVNTLPENPYEL
ncbi:hypothetical protein [Alistipes indistinctus]|jgi:hypothetical protein|uniref:hypothetical protein n=1 Tax=Alistipes indistinctus TaxID=626932 RepID=UPI00205326F8|nr:hypothetical protein [Alistipes indistinctus]DAV65052.1 MAG TPA: hypothetical protein [Caudoviricetes sp.]